MIFLEYFVIRMKELAYLLKNRPLTPMSAFAGLDTQAFYWM